MDTNIQTAKEEIKKSIITLFEIEKLPEDKQEETISRISKIIFQSVLVRVLPSLEENDLAQYEKLVEDGAEVDALLDFLFDKVPFLLEIINEETENFRKESAEVLENIK